MSTRNGMHCAEALPPVRSRSAYRIEAGASKVANLPHDIREQLNLRLLEGETGRELAAWLNALPAVQSILGSQFNGSPISEVNLTHWRQGGYLQWLTERECFDSARALADGDCNLATTGLSVERLLNILTLRYGELLMRWDLPSDESLSEADAFSQIAKKARVLQGISRSVLAIHRIQSQSPREKSGASTSSGSSGGGAGGGQERGEPSASRTNADEHAPNPEPKIQSAVQLNDNSRKNGLIDCYSQTSVRRTSPPVLISAHPSPVSALAQPPLGELGGLGARQWVGEKRTRAKGAKDAKEAGLPKILSGMITPASISWNLAHTPFPAHPDLSELLQAV